jgi:hypothetical protein
MILPELTAPFLAATSATMRRCRTGTEGAAMRACLGLAAVVWSALALGGCVSVSAPDKPIVIELNINIKQEVIYRLAADAGNTIDENAEIF